MKNRIMSVVIALLLAFVAISANATSAPKSELLSAGFRVEHVRSSVPEIPMVESSQFSSNDLNTTSNDGIEFPVNLLPDVSVNSSGYTFYMSANILLSPADSTVAFANKVEVYADISGSGFAWVKTISTQPEVAQDRWWFDAFQGNYLNIGSQLGEVRAAGAQNIRVKLFYTTTSGESLALVYDFGTYLGPVNFWAQPCLTANGNTALDLHMKTLFPVPTGAHVDFRVDGWTTGSGSLGIGPGSSWEWPLYSNVLLGSQSDYDTALHGTSRAVSIDIMGQQWTINQNFYGPAQFLPTCGEGGGKGKKG